MRTMYSPPLICAGLLLLGCSSDCVPVSGGVLVDVRGASSCDGLTVSATEGSNQYQFEATGADPSDGGQSCEFQGLNGHPGTFTLGVYMNGELAATKEVTVRKLDECNVSAEMVVIDLTR